MKPRIPVRPLLLFLVATFATAALGGLATAKGVRDWYPALVKPSFNPPSWVFGPVWTALYLMMSFAAALAWSRADPAGRRRVVALYGVHLAANAAWSFLFFALRAPWLALLDLAALLGLIVAMIALFLPLSGLAALLLAPYLAWCGFAFALNLAIAWLN